MGLGFDFGKQRYLDAQIAVLGSLLISPQIAGEVFAEVRAEDFLSSTYREIFQICKNLFIRQIPVDPVPVLMEMGKNDHNAQLLSEIMVVTPTAANWKVYAKVLKDEALVQRAKEIATEFIFEAVSPDDIHQAVEKLNQNLSERPGVRIVSFSQGLAEFYARHDGKAAPNYLRWGYAALNKRLYAESGDFVILGGYPSAGKTVLAVEFAWQMAAQGNKRVGIFSLETKDEKLYDRLICRVAGVPFTDIKHNTLTSESWASIANISSFTESVKLDVIRASGMTVSDIRAISLAQRYDVIVIDYLQLISTEGKYRGGRVEQVTEISMGLHTFAQTSDTTVIALSQLSRPEKTGQSSKSPTMSSLRESGQLEQDADIIMLLYLLDESDPNGPRRLKIAKNKEGERGHIDFNFDAEKMMFTQLSSRTDDPPPKKRTFQSTWDVSEQECIDVFKGREGGA